MGLIEKGKIIFEAPGKEDSFEVPMEEIIKKGVGHKYDLTLTHTHVYYDANDKQESGEPTCFSKEDVNNFNLKNLDGKYFIKTLVADCHNGSRMILTRTDDTFNQKDLEKVFNNLHLNWSFYLYQSRININKTMIQWSDEYYNKYHIKPSDIEFKETLNQKQKEYAFDNFKDYLQENINEFKKIGFDLSVEWVE